MPEARVNGIKIDYRIQGRGEPIVCIMGYSGAKAAWGLQSRVLSKHFTVLTFDNRGVGKSDKPPGPYTTRMMADDTAALMEHVGFRKAHVMGVSMGGMIAQELAINYPEKVSKLVLGCTYAGRRDGSNFAPELLERLGAGEEYAIEDLRGTPVNKTTSAVIALSFNRPIYRLVVTPLAVLALRFMNKQGLQGQVEACSTHNTFDRLHTIKAPTLVITGTADHIFAAGCSDVLARSIPGAQLVRIEGGSHTFMVEMRKQFNRHVLDFLLEREPALAVAI